MDFQIMGMLIRGLFDKSERDRNARSFLGSHLLHSLPPIHGETEESLCRRVHWEVVKEYGLPRAEHVMRWVRKGREGLVPPRDQIQRWIDARALGLKQEGRTAAEIISDERLKNAILLGAFVDELDGTPLTDRERELMERLEQHC